MPESNTAASTPNPRHALREPMRLELTVDSLKLRLLPAVLVEV